jgi:hypothetical protein
VWPWVNRHPRCYIGTKVKIPKFIKNISNITNIPCLDKTNRVAEFNSNILGGLNMAAKRPH